MPQPKSMHDVLVKDGEEFIVTEGYDGPQYGGCGKILSHYGYKDTYVGFCGGKDINGQYQFCPECELKIIEQYPQGFRYYPGDTCKHGNYVGGCGIDYMCGACEDGE